MNPKNGKIVPLDEVAMEAEPPSQTIASALKAARKDYGLTQQQVGDLAGVSDRTVRTLEQGGVSPSLKALIAVADTLGLTIEVTRR